MMFMPVTHLGLEANSCVLLSSDVTMKRLGDVIIDGQLDTLEHLSFGHDTFIQIGEKVRRL